MLEDARSLGFLGPGPVEPHLDHARGYMAAAPGPPTVAVDLGSGGGVPGLALALWWPSSRWLLVEAQRRRAEFLTRALPALGLEGRVDVAAERAEAVGRDPQHRGAADLVVARSFAAPAVTAECAAPLLSPRGTLIVSEPPETVADDRWPADGLAPLGLERRAIAPAPRRFQAFMQVSPCPDRFPRRAPHKRPLW